MNKIYSDCVICLGSGTYSKQKYADLEDYAYIVTAHVACPLCAMRAERDEAIEKLCLTNMALDAANYGFSKSKQDELSARLKEQQQHADAFDLALRLESVSSQRDALQSKYDTLYNEHVHELHGSMVLRRERDAATARAEAAERAAATLNSLITIRGLACDNARRSAAAWKLAATWFFALSSGGVKKALGVYSQWRRGQRRDPNSNQKCETCKVCCDDCEHEK